MYMKSLKSKLLFISLFAVIFVVRWNTQRSPLPPSWTPEMIVSFTAPILEEPRHTESQTIIEKGIWRIKIKGYQNLDIGERYAFVGKVKTQVLGGKITQIEMMDPTFETVEGFRASVWESLIMGVGRVRSWVVKRYQISLPEPHASLSAGILLGVKANMPYDFYQALINTGTVHIIAASGYNTSIAARVVMVPLLKLLPKTLAILIGVVAIMIYVILAGSSAAVVRSGIMSSLTLMAYYFGRKAQAKRLLWVTAIVMLLVQPLMLVDVGFQLSVAATAGLLYLEPWVKKVGDGLVRINILRGFLSEYLWPTIAASLTTAPIILITFGRLSLISPVVNMLVLPLTPLIMFLSAVAIVASPVPILRTLFMWLLYVPLEVFVRIIWLFG